MESEVIPTRSSLGRILAENAVSRLELPPFNKSAMDGYAVMADDVRDSYRVLECVPRRAVPVSRTRAGGREQGYDGRTGSGRGRGG